jgi:hypothetical protein
MIHRHLSGRSEARQTPNITDMHSQSAPDPILPTWEVRLRRLSIQTRAWLHSPRSILQQFHREGDELLRIYDQDESYDVFQPYDIPRISGLPDSQCRWSIAMILEHLSLSTHDYSRIIANLNQGLVPRGNFDPEQYQPNPSIGTEVRELFVDSIWSFATQVESILESSGGLNSINRFAHAWYGPLTARQWQGLALQQLVIHRRQAQKIIAMMGVA